MKTLSSVSLNFVFEILLNELNDDFWQFLFHCTFLGKKLLNVLSARTRFIA